MRRCCGFPPHCPNLVVELASDSDAGLSALRRKMASYQAHGAQLGWLLIPDTAPACWLTPRPLEATPDFGPGLDPVVQTLVVSGTRALCTPWRSLALRISTLYRLYRIRFSHRQGDGW